MHTHREEITTIDGHLIGICGCGRRKDYTILQNGVKQMHEQPVKGFNMDQIMKGQKGTTRAILNPRKRRMVNQ